MNEGREALPETLGPFGDQKKNNCNVELENRYKSISEKETSNFVKSNGNKNTSRKIDGYMKVFIDWLDNICHENREIHEIEAKKLNMYLARFFLSVRKPDDIEYEPDTLKSNLGSFSPYLRDV